MDGFRFEVTVVLVEYLFTTSETPADVLVANVVSPPYTALMVWEPAVNEAVVRVALPPASVPVPIVVAPSLRVTASPLGGAPIEEVIVAVNVTDCPTKIGFAEATSVVVVEAFDMTWERAVEVLAVKFASPL